MTHAQQTSRPPLPGDKKSLGDTLRARTLANQQTETRLGCALLNRRLQCAKPEAYPITEKA